MKRSAFAAALVLALASTGALAQAAHDHTHEQPAPAQPAPTPPASDEHGHGTASQGAPMDGMKGMHGMENMAGMSGMGGAHAMQMMQPTAANPFPQAEMHMHMAMMHATGADADETYVRKMIEHHRGAIALSRLIVTGSKDPRVQRMANATIAEQTRDIAGLQAWLGQHGKSAQ